MMYVLHPERAAGTGTRGHLDGVGVPQDDIDLGVTGVLGLDLVLHDSVRTVEAGDHGHVGEVSSGRCVQPHRAMQARVVEEVVPVDLSLAVRGVLDDPGWDRLEAEGVVDHRGDARLLTRGDVLADVGLERRVTALVGHDLGPVHPHCCPVRRRLQVQHDALPSQPRGTRTSV
jgi:hypothetical protein